MVKALLITQDDDPARTQDYFERLFADFRGNERSSISYGCTNAHFHYDRNLSEFKIDESADECLIELGVNYSPVSTKAKMDAIRTGNGSALSKTIDGEVLQIFFPSVENLIAVTDPLGLFPFYYCIQNGKLILSTDMKALIPFFSKQELVVDAAAAVEYLTYHSISQDRTLFKGIKRFPSGSIIDFDLNSMGINRISKWYVPPLLQEERPLKEWISLVDSIFTDAVEKRITPNCGSFLSGGMDSRLILVKIPASIRSEMPVLTFGVSKSEDVTIARRVAERFGLHLHYHEIKPNSLWPNALHHLWICDGVSNHLLSFIAESVERLKVPAIFDGTPGDANFGGGYANGVEDLYNGTWPIDPAAYAFSWMKKKSIARKESNVAHLLPNLSRNKVRKVLLEGLRNEFSMLPTEMEPLLQFENVVFDMRIRRYTMGGQQAIDSAAMSLRPYCDISLHDTLLRIPSEQRRDHRFFLTYVRNRASSALDVSSTRDLPGNPLQDAITLLNARMRILFRRLGTRFLRKRAWISGSWLLAEDSLYRRWVKRILTDTRTERRKIINTNAALKMLENHNPGISDHSKILLNAVDLELCLRLFKDRDGFVMHRVVY